MGEASVVGGLVMKKSGALVAVVAAAISLMAVELVERGWRLTGEQFE